MKLLLRQNNHIKKEQDDFGYGCVCSKCGSIFTFDRKDACIPRCPNPDPRYCMVRCPNCQHSTSFDECVKFSTQDEREDFEKRLSQMKE